MIETTLEPAVEAAQPKAGAGAGLVAVLAFLSALAPLSIDMYVPAFPQMTQSFGSTPASIQLSMTACLVGIVMGQLVMGPRSDRLGRRRALLVGTLCFVGFSLLAAIASSVPLLVGARFLQGFTGAIGMVVARAVLNDLLEGAALAKAYAVLIMVIGVAPVIAPVIGAAVLRVASWRAIFAVLAASGLAAVALAARAVPESLPEHLRTSGGVRESVRPMVELLTVRPFVGMVLTLGCASAGMFAYISGSTFVFQEHYGMSPAAYSGVFAVNSLAVILSSMVFGRLSARHSLDHLLPCGIAISVLGAVAQVIFDATHGDIMAVTWICLFVTQLGLAWIIGSTMTLGQSLAQHASGAGSALLGGGQFALGAAIAPVVGASGTGSPFPMAVIMLCAYALCGLVWFSLARPAQQ